MTMLSKGMAGLAAGVAAGLMLASAAVAQPKELLIGDQCDRTGPTQIVGTVLCPAMQDYYKLINSQGGVDGWMIRGDEIDNQYKVPPAIEAYRAPEADGRRDDDALRHAADRGAEPAARAGQDADDLARLRHRRRRRRHPLPLSVPDRRDLLVAGRGGGQVRQGQTGRQPEGQEDRLCLLRQPGRQGADADPRRPAEDGGLRAAHLRGAAAGGRDGGADPRHHPALPPRFRHHASVRPLALGGDQGAEGRRLPAVAR